MKYRYEEAQRAAEVFADEMKAKGNKYYYEFLAILESYERKIMTLEDKLVSSSTYCSETYDCGVCCVSRREYGEENSYERRQR